MIARRDFPGATRSLQEEHALSSMLRERALMRTAIFCARFPVAIACVLACAGAVASPTADAAVHYWRFEGNGAQFLADSLGGATLTVVNGVQRPIPDGSRGADFPVELPVPGGGANAFAGDLAESGVCETSIPGALSSSFTLEAFVHFDTLVATYGKVIAANYRSGNLPGVGLVVRTDGFAGTQVQELVLDVYDGVNLTFVKSGFVLETGIDYYVAVAFDFPGHGVTFYVADLTHHAEVLTATNVHAYASLPLVDTFVIGHTAARDLEFGMDGLIDEVRLSDGVLAPGDLLIGDLIPDSDGDGVVDIQDNCLNAANADQNDTDVDGFGNLCDGDFNQDCNVNFSDLGVMKQNFFHPGFTVTDMTGDGQTNFSDLGLLKAGFFLPPGPSGVPNSCGAG